MRGLLLVIIAITVTACGLSPPPSSSRVYSTQRGGEALPWELKVWNANKTTLRATYTNTTPVGIGAGGFEWEIEGNGNCVQMQFQGVPTLLNIQPRDIVQLSVDGTNAFYGIVDQPPPFKNALVGYTAVGAKKLLERVIPLARRFGAMTDAGQVITATLGGVFNRDGLRVELPPQITYTAGRVSGTLPALGVWRSGQSGESLAQTLDTLSGAGTVGSAAVAWGIDAGGAFFFGVPLGTYSVGYASSGWDRLPVQAADVVSRVGVLLSGQNPAAFHTTVPVLNINTDSRDLDPIMYRTAIDANHLIYNQEIVASVGAQDWFDAVQNAGTGVLADVSSSVTNMTNAMDGNPSTYAFNTSSAAAFFNLERTETSNIDFTDIQGVEIEYSTSVTVTGMSLGLEYNAFTAPVTYVGFSSVTAGIPSTVSHASRNRVRLLFRRQPMSLNNVRLTFFADGAAADEIRVYSLSILRFSSRIDDYARSFIKLPAVVAASLELPGIIAPLPIASVTGVPILGTVTSAAPSWKYSLKRGEGRKTSVQLGNRVISEDSSVIARTVSDADRRDLANARAYTDR